MKKVYVAVFVLLVLAVGAFVAFSSEEEIELMDTHLSGAYQFEDGSLVTIGPSNDQRLRMLQYHDGKPLSLYFDGEKGFKASHGFNSQSFFAKGQFQYGDDGEVLGATWHEDGKTQVVKKLPLTRKTVFFQSGDLMLRGELTMPEGEGPFPVVITVHGSEDYSAVDFYHWPYILAANGIAGFKFDKRGTGGSDGEYTQHFPTLAGDVMAAVDFLKGDAAIDISRVNLIGFSQGGWISPLVAKQIDIQSYIIGFGTTVPVPREDRWGYVKQLLDNGYGEEEIAYADELNAQITKVIFDHDESAWDGLLALKELHQDAPWFKAIAGSDSLLGFVAEKLNHPLADWVPDFGWKLYTKWKKSGNDNGPGFNRTYDPIATLENVSTPSLWLLAGEDTSLPTPDTAADLDRLQAAGLATQYKIYPSAEHGNILYTTDENGDRTYTGYVPSYFSDVVTYFKQQNGL